MLTLATQFAGYLEYFSSFDFSRETWKLRRVYHSHTNKKGVSPLCFGRDIRSVWVDYYSLGRIDNNDSRYWIETKIYIDTDSFFQYRICELGFIHCHIMVHVFSVISTRMRKPAVMIPRMKTITKKQKAKQLHSLTVRAKTILSLLISSFMMGFIWYSLRQNRRNKTANELKFSPTKYARGWAEENLYATTSCMVIEMTYYFLIWSWWGDVFIWTRYSELTHIITARP